QTMHHESWYQGTADAVRRNLAYISEADNDLVLILSGDQLYRMDFQDMVQRHVESRADATIAALPVDQSEATACGIMKIDESGRIIAFVEKPKTDDSLARARTSPEWLDRQGIRSRGRAYLASMGTYLFNTKTLVDLLAGNACDFGREIFPQAIPSNR